MSCNGGVISEEHLPDEDFAHLCLGSEASQVEQATIASGVQVDALFGFAEGVTQQQREQDAKKCRREDAPLFDAAFDGEVRRLLAKFTFPTIVFCSTLRIGPYLYYIEKFTTQFKTTLKLIGHRSCFRENDDLPLRRVPVEKKKPPLSNARALITRKIMRSRDAQCNTRE